MKNLKWGVCTGEGKQMEIVKVFSDYNIALEESVMYTLETGFHHFVQPVKQKVN